MSSVANLPPLSTADYKDIYTSVLNRYYGRENAQTCISKYLSQLALSKQEGLRVLIIGPGTGDDELKLLASHKIDHLTAVEPNDEMADTLEKNLRASSSFIKKWDIERTTIESYLINKTNNDDYFDVIFMIHSIYYISSRGDVLCQIRSLLRPHTSLLFAVITIGCHTAITNKYIPTSKHSYNADDLEHDLRNVDIPFEHHLNHVKLDITGVQNDDKLQWIFASFFLAVNVAYAKNNLAAEVVQDLVNMAHMSEDGKLEIHYREDVFVVRPIN